MRAWIGPRAGVALGSRVGTSRMITVLVVVYFAVLGGLSLLGVHRLALLIASTGTDRRRQTPTPPSWPDLVVVLPMFNEPQVAELAIGSACRLSYPGRLEILVLDDSTDGTTEIVQRMIARQSDDPPLRLLHRDHRRGFKAGALDEALRATSAELIAIFDSDFQPAPDFLLRTVPVLLADPRCGLVQARWGHRNRTRSWLTRAQAVLLDGHFAVEHTARARHRHWLNFNGTAGVFRRAAIEEAGGWRDDSLTEDLDLSYRAQLCGWRFDYLHEVVADAELPERWSAFRTQQARWVKGSLETARLLLPKVAAAPSVPWSVRVDAILHLVQNGAFILMAILAALLPITVIARDRAGWRVPGGQLFLSALDLAMFLCGTATMLVFYLVAAHRAQARIDSPRVLEVLFALCVGAGMSLSNALHAVRGILLRRSEFVRTPKTGASLAHPPRRLTHGGAMIPTGLPRIVLFEAGFAAYFGAASVYAVLQGLLASLPFLMLYFIGFGAVAFGSVREIRDESFDTALRSGEAAKA